MHSTYYIFLAYIIPPKSNGEATVIHGLSAASAGAIATLATHPFDVIKVGLPLSPYLMASFESFFLKTKVQVRSEDRYHGFLRTIYTIWTVS
jgi:solute carrier family 25 protein 38